MREQAFINFGAVRLSSAALGVAGSAAIHAAALAVLYVALSDRPPTRTDAEHLVARGQPIHVRLVTSEEEEEPLPEPEQIIEPPPHVPPLVPPLTPLLAPVETELPGPVEEASSGSGVSAIHKASQWCEQTMEQITDAAANAAARAAQRAIAIERVMSELIDRTPALAPAAEPASTAPTLAEAAPPPSDAATRERDETAVDPAPPAQRSTPQPVGVTEGAAVTSVPRPLYPTRSIRLGQEGTVEIEVEVLADGAVGAARIATSSGHRLLDRAALDAAKQGRYTPAMENGRPVSATIIVPFEFELN